MIEEKDEEVREKTRLDNVLTPAELETIKKTLKNMNIPEPTSWANALYTNTIKKQRTQLPHRTQYDYPELCNLTAALGEAKLDNTLIWQKIEALKATLKHYDEHEH